MVVVMAMGAVNTILKMCQALLCQVLYVLIFLIFIATYETGIFILFTLESRKLRFREEKSHSQNLVRPDGKSGKLSASPSCLPDALAVF